MAGKKRIVSKRVKGRRNEIERFEDEVDKEVREVEKWVLQRRKFFIKLAWVAGLIIVLILVAKFFIR